MNHTPGERSIAWPLDQQSSVLPPYHHRNFAEWLTLLIFPPCFLSMSSSTMACRHMDMRMAWSEQMVTQRNVSLATRYSNASSSLDGAPNPSMFSGIYKTKYTSSIHLVWIVSLYTQQPPMVCHKTRYKILIHWNTPYFIFSVYKDGISLMFRSSYLNTNHAPGLGCVMPKNSTHNLTHWYWTPDPQISDLCLHYLSMCSTYVLIMSHSQWGFYHTTDINTSAYGTRQSSGIYKSSVYYTVTLPIEAS